MISYYRIYLNEDDEIAIIGLQESEDDFYNPNRWLSEKQFASLWEAEEYLEAQKSQQLPLSVKTALIRYTKKRIKNCLDQVK